MKSLIGPGESTTPALAGTTTVFELTATDASKSADFRGHPTECEGTTADPA
jgi:hypothetical protein